MIKGELKKAAIALALVLLVLAPFAIYQKHYEQTLVMLFTFLFAISAGALGLFLGKNLRKSNDPFRGQTIKETANYHNIFDHTKKLQIQVHNEQLQREKIAFPTLGDIKTQKVDEDYVLIFTKDYRTIRLHKDEVMNYCYALIESHYSYFQEGVHNIEITVHTVISSTTPPEPKK